VAAELERHFQRSVYEADDDLVFCHPETGKPYDASKMRKRFYDAMKAAGLGHLVGRENGITFNALRHTFGTRMAAVGVPMRTLQEWMGHRDYATTLIYADFAPDPARGAAFAARAFGSGINSGINVSVGGTNSDQLDPLCVADNVGGQVPWGNS
jgi:integrase